MGALTKMFEEGSVDVIPINWTAVSPGKLTGPPEEDVAEGGAPVTTLSLLLTKASPFPSVSTTVSTIVTLVSGGCALSLTFESFTITSVSFPDVCRTVKYDIFRRRLMKKKSRLPLRLCPRRLFFPNCRSCLVLHAGVKLEWSEDKYIYQMGRQRPNLGQNLNFSVPLTASEAWDLTLAVSAWRVETHFVSHHGPKWSLFTRNTIESHFLIVITDSL